MRFLLPATLALLAGCSASPSTDNRSAAENAAAPAAASADQQAARAVAAGYLADIAKGDFAAARARWEKDGAASGGSAADLARGYAGYSRLALNAGAAGPVSVREDGARVVVPVTGTATVKRTGEKQAMAGNIYLHRAAPDGGAAPRDWRIWGADIRRDH